MYQDIEAMILILIDVRVVKNPAASYGALKGKTLQIEAELIVMDCLLDTERTLGGVVIPIPATTPPKHNLCLPLLAPSSKTGVLHDATSVPL